MLLQVTLEVLPKFYRQTQLKTSLVPIRQQAKGLRKVHLRDCLLDAQSKHQNERAKAIKLKLHREESKRMWYLIKRTVKDPHSPSVLKVQRVVEGKIEEYTVQEDVKQAIQRECEVRFLLAHSAPIMKSLLGEKLRYLSDEALAKAIITGTYDIPTSLDPATAMILKEIGKLGMKIVNGDSNEIVISPEDFKRFWKKVNEFTSSSMSGVHYGHYKAAIQDPQSTNALALQLTIIACSGIPPESWSSSKYKSFSNLSNYGRTSAGKLRHPPGRMSRLKAVVQGDRLEPLVDHPFDDLPDWLEEADATVVTTAFWDEDCDDPAKLGGYPALVPDGLLPRGHVTQLQPIHMEYAPF